MFKSWRKKSDKKHHHHDQKKEHDTFCELQEDERVAEYLRQAEEGWQHAWEIYTSQDWKVCSGKDLYTGIVTHKHDTDGRKIFKLDGYVDAHPVEVFNQLVHGDDQSHVWNPTVKYCSTLQVIDKCTDVKYNIGNPAAGGLVSSRDFVNLRRWKTVDGNCTLCLGQHTCHPDAPPTHKYVRGENHPAAWVFKSVDGGDRCEFTLILKTDLKGWLPHYLVDQAMTGVMVNYIKYLRERLHSIRQNPDLNEVVVPEGALVPQYTSSPQSEATEDKTITEQCNGVHKLQLSH